MTPERQAYALYVGIDIAAATTSVALMAFDQSISEVFTIEQTARCWQDALHLVKSDTVQVAPARLSVVLEKKITGSTAQAQNITRDNRFDQRNGS